MGYYDSEIVPYDTIIKDEEKDTQEKVRVTKDDGIRP